MKKEMPIREFVYNAVKGGIDEIGDEGISAIALLAHGMSYSSVAKTLGVSPSVVKGWTETRGFMSAVGVVRENIDVWHRAQFATAAALAWKKIVDFLSKDIKPGEAGYKEQIRLAESIAIKASSAKFNIEEESSVEEISTLQVSPTSVDLIARRVSQLQSEGSGERKSQAELRRYNPDELPPIVACHPDTKYGSMSRGENGWYLCHVCGKEDESFFQHIESKHKMTASVYASVYGIDDAVFAVEYTR